MQPGHLPQSLFLVRTFTQLLILQVDVCSPHPVLISEREICTPTPQYIQGFQALGSVLGGGSKMSRLHFQLGNKCPFHWWEGGGWGKCPGGGGGGGVWGQTSGDHWDRMSHTLINKHGFFTTLWEYELSAFYWLLKCKISCLGYNSLSHWDTFMKFNGCIHLNETTCLSQESQLLSSLGRLCFAIALLPFGKFSCNYTYALVMNKKDNSIALWVNFPLQFCFVAKTY